jgi:hypothetical protein
MEQAATPGPWGYSSGGVMPRGLLIGPDGADLDERGDGLSIEDVTLVTHMRHTFPTFLHLAQECSWLLTKVDAGFAVDARDYQRIRALVGQVGGRSEPAPPMPAHDDGGAA